MDPNELLDRIRKLAMNRFDNDIEVDANDADALAETIEVLDTWLSSGGFLPEAWTKNRKAPKGR